MLRSFNTGHVDSNGFCDQLQQLFGVIFELVGHQEGWALQWVWSLYQRHLQTFLTAAGAASGGAAIAVFRQYWGSLPWSRATFHSVSPEAIACIRTYLPTSDRAAVELLHSLDWGEVLAKSLPSVAVPSRAFVTTSAPAPLKNEGVFTLMDNAEDEAAELDIHPHRYMQSVSSERAVLEQAEWAAELGMLLLQAAVYLPSGCLPDWMRDLLGENQHRSGGQQKNGVGGGGDGDDGEQEERGEEACVSLLASANWKRVLSAMVPAMAPSVPWLVLPLLLAPQSVEGDDADERLLRAALLLCRAAGQSGSLIAATTAVERGVKPLFGFSICQGVKMPAEQEQLTALGTAQHPALSAVSETTAVPSHEIFTIPSDIPPELLEGTVELEQMRLQQEELRLAQEELHAAAAAADPRLQGAGRKQRRSRYRQEATIFRA